MPDPQAPFWRRKAMSEMTRAEWESLCDGCGRCCLVKLEDEDTGEIHFTDIGCKLLDGKTCRCIDYPRRHRKVPDCVRLTPQNVRRLNDVFRHRDHVLFHRHRGLMGPVRAGSRCYGGRMRTVPDGIISMRQGLASAGSKARAR
jgi:uncharacterized cysteine cluster protein YcgN (CxxCxxCC family)